MRTVSFVLFLALVALSIASPRSESEVISVTTSTNFDDDFGAPIQHMVDVPVLRMAAPIQDTGLDVPQDVVVYAVSVLNARRGVSKLPFTDEFGFKAAVAKKNSQNDVDEFGFPKSKSSAVVGSVNGVSKIAVVVDDEFGFKAPKTAPKKTVKPISANGAGQSRPLGQKRPKPSKTAPVRPSMIKGTPKLADEFGFDITADKYAHKSQSFDVSSVAIPVTWSERLASLAKATAVLMCPTENFGTFGLPRNPKSADKGLGFVAYHVVGRHTAATRLPSNEVLNERARTAVQEILPRRTTDLRKRFCKSYSDLMSPEASQIGCGAAFCTGNYYTLVCFTDAKSTNPRQYC